MPKTEHSLRREISAISKLIWDRGWVANHDGNVTAKLAPGRIVATPTGVSKRLIEAESAIVVDESKRVVRGRAKAFSELGLHLTVYAGRPDVGAVLHAHPPFATARAVLDKNLPCFIPESVVSIGAEVPLVPFTMPGSDSEKALAPYLRDYDAVLLARHGVLTWGDDLEQAFLRMELVEHLAKIAHAAGEARPLPDAAVTDLLKKRTAAGLGAAGRAAAKPKK